MQHHFEVEIACDVGVNAAVIFDAMLHRIAQNMAQGRHEIDGKFWTYQAVKGLTDVYPYLGDKAIRNAIKKLIDSGYILKGEYNEKNYDKTSWYALGAHGLPHLPKRRMELSKRRMHSAKGRTNTPNKNQIPNGICQKGDGKKKKSTQSQIPKGYPDSQALKDGVQYLAKHDRMDLAGRLSGEAERFALHHAAKGSKFKDWRLAWLKWLRQFMEYNPAQPTSGRVPVSEYLKNRGAA